MQLSPVQARILGCLVEKERTTPDNYPLTMNSLLAACNQSTNRFPVVSFTEAVVSNAILNLRSDNLLRIDYSRSNRADKYRHVLEEALEVDEGELALLAVLMLRGPQTAAELRSRTERLHPFADQGDVDATLVRLSKRADALVTWLAPQPGQKEARWAHLLSGPIAPEDLPQAPAQSERSASRTERVEALEAAVEALTDELKHLRADHDALAARLEQLL